MRLIITKFIPSKIAYFILALLILFLLTAFGTNGAKEKPSSNNHQFTPKVQGELEKPSAPSLPESPELPSNSQSTQINVSINAHSSNGETTGSATVQVTKNGQTQTFASDLSNAIEDATGCDNFDIKINNGEVDFDCDFDQDTSNETRVERNVRVENESD